MAFETCFPNSTKKAAWIRGTLWTGTVKFAEPGQETGCEKRDMERLILVCREVWEEGNEWSREVRKGHKRSQPWERKERRGRKCGNHYLVFQVRILPVKSILTDVSLAQHWFRFDVKPQLLWNLICRNIKTVL